MPLRHIMIQDPAAVARTAEFVGANSTRPNKLTADVKAAITAAFDEVGGAD